MALAKKQTHRSIENNKINKETHAINHNVRGKYTMEKT